MITAAIRASAAARGVAGRDMGGYIRAMSETDKSETPKLTEAAKRALAEAEADGSVRTVVITGDGDRAFSAGGDFEMLLDLAAQGRAAPGVAHLSDPTSTGERM